MKILAFSDFHGLFGFKDHFIDVKNKIEKYQPDLVIICGDLQDRGSIKLLENRIQNVDFPNIFFVWGNSEEQLDPSKEIKFAENLHLKLKDFKEVYLIGIGGDEYDMKREIPKVRKILSTLRNDKPLIIISHVPPKNTVDLCNDGRNVGVMEFRELIIEFKPLLVACGHIHEEVQKSAWLDQTMVCNIGPDGILFTIVENKIFIETLN